ncbi:hypothetical protein [Vagococcus sp. WN89Y]|uniref:hypothetical protein n=1 Tax=Vagococcus sp. WN89Y TaxID=3457258 RepID=UPI003FCDDDC2
MMLLLSGCRTFIISHFCCKTQFIPADHSPVGWTFLLVAIHVLIGTLWSLMLIIATRYAAGICKGLQW